MDSQSRKVKITSARQRSPMTPVAELDNMTVTTAQRGSSERKIRKLLVNGFDVTPRSLFAEDMDKFDDLIRTLDYRVPRLSTASKISKLAKASRFSVSTIKEDVVKTIGMKTTIDDVFANIYISPDSNDDIPVWKRRYSDDDGTLKAQLTQPQAFMKVILRESREFVLFEKQSVTVPKDSSEAKSVEEDNRRYDYLTVGKGRVRRKAEGEAQTNELLYKARYANTETIKKVEAGTFVSNYDMFDTYAQLERSTTSVMLDDERKMDITTYKLPGDDDEIEEIISKPNFSLAVMLTERLLAGNVFTEKQKRFRNMYVPDRLDLHMKYRYTIKELWTFPKITFEQMAVSQLSICPTNGDILAVGYGVFCFTPMKKENRGYCCVWSIKNPVNPERKYEYEIPVSAVQFSEIHPQLLAIGLYNGTVEVRDITKSSNSLVAVSSSLTSPVCEPVLRMSWMKVSDQERLLAVSTDGILMKYYLLNSPYLFGMVHIKLDRVVGSPEGLFVYRKEQFIEANRNPRGLTLCLHPEKSDVSYVLTDEGCMHKCSANFPNQSLDVLQVHEGCVYGMDFSPWSPKLFLTCGSDWCIRVWLEGMNDPLIKLICGIGPVHCASWSITHSTIIMCTIGNIIQIWDIRRSILKPVFSRSFGSVYTNLTVAKFSNCGRSIIVGDEFGQVYLCALEDMPFPPYFQYEELEKAIFKAIQAYPELTREVKSMGFFGYKHKEKPKALEDIPC